MINKDLNGQHKRLRKISYRKNSPWYEEYNPDGWQKVCERKGNVHGAVIFLIMFSVFAIGIYSNFEGNWWRSFLLFVLAGLLPSAWGGAVLGWALGTEYKTFEKNKHTPSHWDVPTMLWEVINLPGSKTHLPNALVDRAREELSATIAAAEVLDWAETYPDKKDDPQVVEAQKILDDAETFINTTLKGAYTVGLKSYNNYEAEKKRPQRAVKTLEVTNESPYTDEALALEWKEKMEQS